MHSTAIRMNGNVNRLDPIATLEYVRDRLLQSDLFNDRAWLASQVAEVVGMLKCRPEPAPAAARHFLDGIADDFEITDSPADWPSWTDESRWTTTDATPIELLIPPIEDADSSFEPTAAQVAELDDAYVPSGDEREFRYRLAELADGCELPETSSYYTEEDARAAGLAI
jgi:hypothetical protein